VVEALEGKGAATSSRDAAPNRASQIVAPITDVLRIADTFPGREDRWREGHGCPPCLR